MTQPLSGGVLVSDAGAIAAALEETARQVYDDLEGTEQLAAYLPPSPGITDTVEKLRRRAELIGIAYAYFKEMAEHPETPVVFERTVYGVPGITSAPPVTKP